MSYAFYSGGVKGRTGKSKAPRGGSKGGTSSGASTPGCYTDICGGRHQCAMGSAGCCCGAMNKCGSGCGGSGGGKGGGMMGGKGGGSGGGGSRRGSGGQGMMQVMTPSGQVMMVTTGGKGNCKGGFQGQSLHMGCTDCINAGADPACCAAALKHGNPMPGVMKGYYINNCCNCNQPECSGKNEYPTGTAGVCMA
jgi:hypothetical protein